MHYTVFVAQIVKIIIIQNYKCKGNFTFGSPAVRKNTSIKTFILVPSQKKIHADPSKHQHEKQTLTVLDTAMTDVAASKSKYFATFWFQKYLP